MAITKSFTATGFSDVEPFISGAFSISGTFDGTVQLQHKINAVWKVIASYTIPTAVGNQTSFDNGASLPMRFECSAFTSGTIVANLQGSNQAR